MTRVSAENNIMVWVAGMIHLNFAPIGSFLHVNSIPGYNGARRFLDCFPGLILNAGIRIACGGVICIDKKSSRIR